MTPAAQQAPSPVPVRRQALRVYAIFHLNIAFSSIPEGSRPALVERCYRPLLDLAAAAPGPIGIEATGLTLEVLSDLAPDWIARLRGLIAAGRVVFIGSAYAQAIGPLLPAAANRRNLRLGREVYAELLGAAPRLALVNEQTYGPGLPRLYAEAGYEGLVMEWENCFRAHPDWPPERRYRPARVLGNDDAVLPLVWSHTIPFQKLQRTAHGEFEPDEFAAFVAGHRTRPGGSGPQERALCLYCNDAEVFDFRPGRFEAEPGLAAESEWSRLARALAAVAALSDTAFIDPEALLPEARDGPLLRLESAGVPLPTKKQAKYTVLRWAVSGRSSLSINTRCQRIADRLAADPAQDDTAWKELCLLWGSDFRTHIATDRWQAYRQRLARFEAELGLPPWQPGAVAAPAPAPAAPLPGDQRLLTIATGALGVSLNQRRGLAVERCWLADAPDRWLFGTLHLDHFEDITLGADWYSGNVVQQSPGAQQVTDLGPCLARIDRDSDPEAVLVQGMVATSLGPVLKRWRVFHREPRLDLDLELHWTDLPRGLLRLGFVTLNPDAFDRSSLAYACHNGGVGMDRHSLAVEEVDHGRPVSLLVSAGTALGVTEGRFEIGDAGHRVCIAFDRAAAALVGLVTCRRAGESYFAQIAFSAAEMDDTSRAGGGDEPRLPRPFRLTLSHRLQRL